MKEKEKYAIIGVGGIRIVFSSLDYDDNTATQRAQNLDCKLFKKYSDGRVVQIYPEKAVVDKFSRNKILTTLSPEMLNNSQYVPGIQMLIP